MHADSNPEKPALPLILLASDQPLQAARLDYALREQNLAVKFAPGYAQIEPLAKAHESAIVLLEVSRHESVEAAVALALRIKRINAYQFVGYLADSTLHSSGLAGDGIFPRTAQHLAHALQVHFENFR